MLQPGRMSSHPNINECRCPKWLYVNKRGEKRKRYAPDTPSWAEALREATPAYFGRHAASGDVYLVAWDSDLRIADALIRRRRKICVQMVLPPSTRHEDPIVDR